MAIFNPKTILVKKRLPAFLLLLFSLGKLNGQQGYWQQQVNFNIEVALNDVQHTLTGFERIEYINNSPDTLTYIWFHTWPNAYRNDRTAFSDQMLVNGNTAFYFSSREDKGYINKLDFKVDNHTAETEDHPEHIDIIKVLLPSPLLPGAKVEITTPFHVKLPQNFSRGGHDGQSYQVTQWFPKPAVYDRNGWHPMTYLDQGEYYSEFGNYDVSITVPSNYVVAATGDLQNAEEKAWLLERGQYSWEPVKKKVKSKGGSFKTVYENFPPSETGIKILRFKQDRIHDFAWFADKRFIVNLDTCRLASGKIIDIYNYYTSEYKDAWLHNINRARAALRHYSSLVGDYPYGVVSIVQGPTGYGGGMEYPTITLISATKDSKELDLTIAHEIGHNWFYGILASNERANPWLDEGINSYYEKKYEEANYGLQYSYDRILLETKAMAHTDQPMNTPSEAFSAPIYNLVAYYKADEWIRYLEQSLGSELFNGAMKAYFEEWKFRHPGPDDFKRSIERHTGRKLDTLFALVDKKGILPHLERRGTDFSFFLRKRALKEYLKNPPKNLISYGPSIGYNAYDKFMIGGLLTNFKLPPSRFQFLAIPMYATASKKFNGIGLASWSIYPKGGLERIDIGISASRFSRDKYEDTSGNKFFFGFNKVVPGFRMTFRNKDPRKDLLKYIQFKTFLIGEERLSFRRDSTIIPDTAIFVPYSLKDNRVLNQLTLVIENPRVLYPFRVELKAEQGNGFIRLAFTGNYFFNYSNRQGGADIRLFAGKFIYTNESKADPFLYGLNLSAPKGNLDYTYSDYFIGRNDYPFRSGGEQWTVPYQQIMIRDGALKMNTDAQGNVGWSDDWIAAINGTFDIPDHLNPLSLLPFRIPLKAFVDVGTYAGPWEKGATADRFLYDAGLQVPLAHGLVNVYIPILYSKVYSDYLKSTVEKKGRFFKTIAFSIDISKFNSRRFTREIIF